jgi:hypothetical protein
MTPRGNEFGSHIVYVDESGDHGLVNVSDDYPVFVLLFTLFSKRDYYGSICPALRALKVKYWGHDEIVFHEHELRKPKGVFQILHDSSVRKDLTNDLADFIARSAMTVVAVVIDKRAFVAKYRSPVSPYDYALEAGLERIYLELHSRGDDTLLTPVVVECRGPKEDADLELAFRRVCDGRNMAGKKFPFSLRMIPKTANSAGLQIADLMARPVGLNHFRKGQPNRAFDVIQTKLRRSSGGRVDGYGLKVLP